MAATHSVALDGLVGRPIEVEVDINSGMPGTVLVGLADTIVNEARDRVRAAVVNSGTSWPDQRVTINLAPSTSPRPARTSTSRSPLAVFVAKRVIPADALAGAVLLGELALDGRLRAVRGVLPATMAAAAAGFARVFVPESNAPEAGLVPGIDVVGLRSLRQLVAMLDGAGAGRPAGSAAGRRRRVRRGSTERLGGSMWPTSPARRTRAPRSSSPPPAGTIWR